MPAKNKPALAKNSPLLNPALLAVLLLISLVAVVVVLVTRAGSDPNAASNPYACPQSESYNHPTLRNGGNDVTRTDKCVSHLQWYLGHKFGYTVAVDGVFDPVVTGGAVSDFQKKYGLVVDGIVGPATWGALHAYTNPDPKPTTNPYSCAEPIHTTLRYGSDDRKSSSQCVRHLQFYLNQRQVGSYGLAVDGIFGRNTESATRDYQAKHGLDADGIVGTKTWTSLHQFCNCSKP